MANMGYCRFQNTLADLHDCYDRMGNEDLSEAEQKACVELIGLCEMITSDYGTADEDAA